MISKEDLTKSLSNIIKKEGSGALSLPWLPAVETDKYYELKAWTSVIPQSSLIRTISAIPLSSRDTLDIHRAGANYITAIDRDNKVDELLLGNFWLIM